ncbi:MAG: DUF4097 family beta strand repeat-containing protein [Halobacteriales archaeon]
MQRRAALGAVAAGLAVAASGCLEALLPGSVAEPFERRAVVDAGTSVAVENRNGPVRIEPAADDELVVRGERRASSPSALETIRVVVDLGDSIVVRVVHDGGDGWRNRQVDLTVEVPDGVVLTEASTANGDVTVRDVGGDPHVHTTNGDVDVARVDGYVRGASTNGDVTVTGGLDGARTRNGNLDLGIDALRRDVTAETVNGDVTTRIGPEVVATVRLRAGNGAVAVEDLPVEETSSSRTRLDGHLRGDDGPTLRLVTTNGDVVVRPP